MSKYMIDDVQVNTANAKKSWDEATYFNGSNRVSENTGSEWTHQTLHLSRNDRYYIEHTSQWQGSKDYADFVTDTEAAAWLLANNYDEEQIPENLRKLAAAKCE